MSRHLTPSPPVPPAKKARTLVTAQLQEKVNAIHKIPENNTRFFNEFSDESGDEISALVKELSEADGVESAIQLASDTITEKKEVPYLVKLALGIFLTHSEEARALGVKAPPIRMHSKFRREVELGKMQPPVPPPDDLVGPDKVTYWLEDYDLSDHHYHWHLVYPYTGIWARNAQKKLYEKRTIDRQGELFIYMHSQMVSRLNAELLSWDQRVLDPWKYRYTPKQGYTPAPALQAEFCIRPALQGWYDVRNPQNDGPKDQYPPIKDMADWRDLIFKAIDDGAFSTIPDGTVQLTADNALNWLGITIEAERKPCQEVSPGVYIDRDKYQSLHNRGHMKFGEIGYTKKENQYGVISNNVSAVRDPLFFHWHRHVDEFRMKIIRKYKHNLDEFKPEAKILDLEIVPRKALSKTPKGGISTMISPPRIELNEASAKLHHEPYEWKVAVESTRDPPPSLFNPQTFTVRIFIAPEKLVDDDSELGWIEMDKFTHTIHERKHTITRKDFQSSVARKKSDILDSMDADGMEGAGEDGSVSAECDCGWPPNLMLPAGLPEGMPFVAFAMLTSNVLGKCTGVEAISFCGVKDGAYPDSLGMGYPFNKTWEKVAATVADAVAGRPHIRLQNFKIYRQNKLE